MVISKIIDGKKAFICEICKADYSGREEAEDFDRAEKCEESCKQIYGGKEIEAVWRNKK